MRLSVSQLVNLQRFKSAYTKATKVVRLEPTDAHNWFQVALAANLLNMPNQAESAHLKARSCPNFNNWLDGSFYRDHAIRAIHYGFFPLANYCLGEVKRLHVDEFFRLMSLAAPRPDQAVEALRQHWPLEVDNDDELKTAANCVATWLDIVGRYLRRANH